MPIEKLVQGSREERRAVLEVGRGLRLTQTGSTGRPCIEAGAVARVSVTAAYSVTDQDDTVDVDATSGAVAITLPSAVDRNGRQFRVTRTSAGSNNVTVSTTGGQTINGTATKVLGAQWQSALLYSDGANWVAV